jgi:ABC-type transport system involved in multi-copper enzyme maturation permease subunit
MAILPIIERELRVALRKKRPVRRRLQVAALAVGGTLLFLLMAAVWGNQQAGHNLHQLLCLAAAYLVLQTPQLTAGIFAQERREQTLGLLFLSGLGASEVFASKLFSAALVAFGDLLALFPMLAVPFLIGGVSFELFLATICAWPNFLLFVLAVCLLASVLTRDDGTAVILTAVLLFLLCGAGPLIYLAQSQFSATAKLSSAWLLVSPAYGPYLTWRGFGMTPVSEFWNNLGVTLAWTCLCLTVAAVALKSLWREREQDSGAFGWRTRWQRWLHGDARSRRRLAATWLQANPFVWLAARDRQPAILAWLVVGGTVAVWLGCWAAWPKRWPSVPNLFLTATLLNLALRWVIHFTAARSLGDARHDGSYELLLTTPLDPGDIVGGEFEASRWHFRRVAQTVLALEFAMMLAGLTLRNWTGSALYVYSAIWTVLLAWAWNQSSRWRATSFVLWASLNSARPAYAVSRAMGLTSWSWLWIVFNLQFLFAKLPAFPTGSQGEVWFVSFILVMALVPLTLQSLFDGNSETGWGNRVWKGWERRLVNEFRDIVREPLPDPDDPRFKQWKPGERFPWGWDLAQQEFAATRRMITPAQFAAAWRDYRRRRRWFIGTGVGGVVIATLVFTLSNRPPLGLVSFWALGPAWMICVLVVAVRFQLFKCPRCRLPFSNGNPLARTCQHCGLPKWSANL